MEKETEKDMLNRIYKENGLCSEDIYTDKRGFKLITRRGIQKIVGHHNIKVKRDMVVCNLGVKDIKNNVVIKCTAISDKGMAEAFGESSDLNLGPFNKAYPVAMASKRAEARAVILLVGVARDGIMSEDEPEHIEAGAYSEAKINSVVEKLAKDKLK